VPLSPTPLENDLASLLRGDAQPGSAAEAGKAWAAAYGGYAASATAGPTLPLAPTLKAAELALAQALGNAFDAAQQAGAAGTATVLPALDSAFVAFWLAPPVAFAGPAVTGLVTVAPPAVLAGAIATVLAAGMGGAAADQQATALATALDTWTRTVMVVNTTAAGPQPPVPLT
jgi:hypothetical protein